MKFSDFAIIKSLKEAGDPMFQGDYDGPLTERERWLLGIAVAVTRGCPECAGKRIEGAKKAGIDEKIIIDAVNLCAGVNAGHTVTMAVNGTRDVANRGTVTGASCCGTSD
jgi:alkylhydroperoxidase/carboxymuconolactone decarboxylase family protein YurZ